MASMIDSSCHASVSVRLLSGEVLFGPEQLAPGTNAGDLKRLLSNHQFFAEGGSDALETRCLVHADRELQDEEVLDTFVAEDAVVLTLLRLQPTYRVVAHHTAVGILYPHARRAMLQETEDEEPHFWLTASRAFHAEWFPDDGAVQHFWFGARRPNLRARFSRLADEFERPCVAAAKAALRQPLGVAGASTSVPGWPTAALVRMRLRTAIFLDQMSRNIVAVRESQLCEIDGFVAMCDAAAVPLALSVIGEAGVPICAAKLLAFANPTEICFLSLVLRHSRQRPYILIASQVLNAVLEELSRSGESRHLESSGVAKTPFELCERFLLETRDALDAINVEAYLRRAFSVDEPLQLAGPPAGVAPRLTVLDTRCLHIDGDVANPPFLKKLVDPSLRGAFCSHSLVNTLSDSLEELGFLSEDRGIVLSLSGGVDSMVTCCLLSLLHERLPASQRFKWCALHLCHPNRSDATDEEGWVQWSCNLLGVDLYTYHLEIRRPHGNLRTGISRDRYEEKSKELRFRMYARCLAKLGVSHGAALVAHHQDDADENRLAELGKGNILHIDGMAMRSSMLGVEVIRPLLPVRKADLLAFANDAAVCYMQDSTPRWSRRGWIRKVLDELGELPMQELKLNGHLLTNLTLAGAASEKFGNLLDASLKEWKAKSIESGVLSVPVMSARDANQADAKKADANKKKKKEAPQEFQSVEVVVLWLQDIVTLATDFGGQLASLQEDIGKIADVWNSALDAQVPRQDTVPDTIDDDGDEGEHGDDGNSAGACPLQRISVHRSGLGVGPFLFSRAIYAASNDFAAMQTRLRGQPVARKALIHIWDSITRARLEYQWGSLHKSCPCLYLRDRCCLILPDAEGRDADLADRQWQREFARAALAFTQRSHSTRQEQAN